MIARALSLLLPCVACVAACGSFGAAEQPADAGLVNDATDVPPDGATPSALPPPPPECPFTQCPNAEPTCRDDDCDEPSNPDFTPVGAVTYPNGKCRLVSTGTPATLTRSLSPTTARTNVTLAVTVYTLDALAGTVMALGIEDQPQGERVIVVLEDGQLKLCEQHGGAAPTCAAPLAVTFPQTLHLWGAVTSQNPPTAKFALGTGCAPERTIEVTKPFGGGKVEGVVGCIDTPAGCTMELDNALLLLRPQ